MKQIAKHLVFIILIDLLPIEPADSIVLEPQVDGGHISCEGPLVRPPVSEDVEGKIVMR